MDLHFIKKPSPPKRIISFSPPHSTIPLCNRCAACGLKSGWRKLRTLKLTFWISISMAGMVPVKLIFACIDQEFKLPRSHKQRSQTMDPAISTSTLFLLVKM